MPPTALINTPTVEAWPARWLRARGNHAMRALSLADYALRRKADGRILAARIGGEPIGLAPGWQREPGLEHALRAIGASRPATRVPELPLSGLHRRLHALGLDAGAYQATTGLALVAEPAWLAFAGLDRYRRVLWLHRDAAAAWQRLRMDAAHDGIALEAVSGYRSHDYQLGIFERKLARGLQLAGILEVNAAPGYSEHHSGRAIDISAPGEPAAEESFEATDAFAWLRAHAAGHGFVMSYPRDNPHGIVYEPWHWCYRAGGSAHEGGA